MVKAVIINFNTLESKQELILNYDILSQQIEGKDIKLRLQGSKLELEKGLGF
jgi:hypothetical protein